MTLVPGLSKAATDDASLDMGDEDSWDALKPAERQAAYTRLIYEIRQRVQAPNPDPQILIPVTRQDGTLVRITLTQRQYAMRYQVTLLMQASNLYLVGWHIPIEGGAGVYYYLGSDDTERAAASAAGAIAFPNAQRENAQMGSRYAQLGGVDEPDFGPHLFRNSIRHLAGAQLIPPANREARLGQAVVAMAVSLSEALRFNNIQFVMNRAWAEGVGVHLTQEEQRQIVNWRTLSDQSRAPATESMTLVPGGRSYNSAMLPTILGLALCRTTRTQSRAAGPGQCEQPDSPVVNAAVRVPWSPQIWFFHDSRAMRVIHDPSGFHTNVGSGPSAMNVMWSSSTFTTGLDAAIPVPGVPGDLYFFKGSDYERIQVRESDGYFTDTRVVGPKPIKGNWMTKPTFPNFDFDKGVSAGVKIPVMRDQAYLFQDDQVVRLKVDTDDVQGGGKISDVLPSLAGTKFAKGVDAAVEIPGSDNDFYLFRGSQYCRVHLSDWQDLKDSLATLPEDIDQAWPVLSQLG